MTHFRKPEPPARPPRLETPKPPGSPAQPTRAASLPNASRKIEEIRLLWGIFFAFDVVGALFCLFAAPWAILLFGFLGLAVALIARSKGRETFFWFLYGFGPWIVALPHALLMQSDVVGIEQRLMAQGQRKCPFCAEMIKVDAMVCRYCGRDVPAS